MIIKNDDTVRDIQQRLSQKFPFLRIEFYQQEFLTNKMRSRTMKWDQDKMIGEIRSEFDMNELEISGKMQVRVLENLFLKGFGLPVKIFYKSGDIWFPTKDIDESTLDDHNEIEEVAENARKRAIQYA